LAKLRKKDESIPLVDGDDSPPTHETDSEDPIEATEQKNR